MKRDWDLIRQILLTCEDAPSGQHIGPNAFPALDKAVVFEHVRILADAGYLEARLLPFSTGASGGEFVILRLAWDGYDLLAKMKSDTWWNKIKQVAADKGLPLTFDVIKALAMPVAKGLLGLDDVS